MDYSVNERINEIISKNGYKSRRAFSDKIGVAQTSLNDILKGAEPKFSTLNKILKAEPLISAEWLLLGEGSMLKEEDAPKISYAAGVPYYNVDFIGGFDLVLNNQTITPEYNIDFKTYNSADCWCNVTGHSMEPEISQGDIIALKELTTGKHIFLQGKSMLW